MNPIAHRVASRFVAAQKKTAGDVAEALHEFERRVNQFGTLEPDEAKYNEALRTIGQAVPRSPEWMEAQNTYFTLGTQFRVGVAGSWPHLSRCGKNLFLTLLQNLSLAPKIRKGAEAAARYYTPTKTRATYPELLKQLREHLALAKAAIAEGVSHSAEGSETRIPAGPFTLVNTGGFKPEVMAECVEVAEKAATLLRAKGLGRVCYGEILVTNTLSKASVLAFYRLTSDELYLRANLKGKKVDAVRTLLHELGHRLDTKFLGSKGYMVKTMYETLQRSERGIQRDLRDAVVPKSGDTLMSKGRLYVVADKPYANSKVHVFLQADPTVTGTIAIQDWVRLKTPNVQTSAFVTPYAKKDEHENFAEMVSFYCMGNLPADQATMLEKLFS